MKKLHYLLILTMGLLMAGCNLRTPENNNDDDTGEYPQPGCGINTLVDPEDGEGTEEEETGQIEDGTYSATVDYYNPDTNFSNTYTLDVVVEDGCVVEIDFPKGGYLDSDHIAPTELDENGCCTVTTFEGLTYDISIN